MESTQPTQTVTTTTYTAPSNRSSILLILLSLLALLLLLSTAYFGYQNMQLQKQIAQLSTPLPTPTPNPWKGYTYKDIMFEYPSEWTVKISEFGSASFHPNPEAFEQIQVSAIDNPKDLSVQEYQVEAKKDGPSPNFYSPQARERTIEGVVIGYQVENTHCEPTLCDTFAFAYNKKIYVITTAYDVYAKEANPAQRDIYNRLLNTITLVDNRSIITPTPTEKAETQTMYTDNDVPFQITYPNTWTLRKTYGKSVNNVNNYRVSGVDISTNLSVGSTLVVNIIDPVGNSFFDWLRLYSGETDPPTTTNSYYQNIPAVTIERPNQGKPATVHTYFEDGGYIVFMAKNASLADQARAAQILSTFTFTN